LSKQPFSASYAQAREKFLEAASAAGLQPQSHVHPLKGRDGETLAMDLAWAGDPKADRLPGRPDASADQARKIRQQMMNAFYVDTDAWRGPILGQALEAMVQAAEGLAA